MHGWRVWNYTSKRRCFIALPSWQGVIFICSLFSWYNLTLSVFRLCETLILCILYMQTMSLHVTVQKALLRVEEQDSEQFLLYEFVRYVSAGKGDAICMKTSRHSVTRTLRKYEQSISFIWIRRISCSVIMARR